MDYKRTIGLNHNESAYAIDEDTGEARKIPMHGNNIPADKTIFNQKGKFHKSYELAWDYLLDHLSDKEIRIVNMMSQMARMNSNSLEPLSNTSTITEIAETFKIHRNHVKKIFNNLLIHGVYAEFKFGAKGKIKQYWVLNPYISFKGKTISRALVDLFRETDIACLCVE